MQSHVVANLPGQQRVLFRKIVANQQNSWSSEDVGHAGGAIGFASKRSRQSGEVRRAMVVHIVRLEDQSSELGEQVVLFVSGASRTDHPNRRTALTITNLGKFLSDQRKRFFPRSRIQLAIFANQRLRQPVF